MAIKRNTWSGAARASIYSTDIHSTFRIRCPGKGKVSVKHHGGQGCAFSQSSSRWPFTSRLCWLWPPAAGSARGVWGKKATPTFIRRSKTADCEGASSPERSRTPGQGRDSGRELLPSLSATTHTSPAKLQPAPRVTP